MIRTILRWLFVLVIGALIFAWILRGGPVRLWERITTFATPEWSWGEGVNIFSLKLPYQPDSLFSGITIDESGALYGADGSGELQDIEAALAELEAKARDVREFGAPSPYAGSVELRDAGARAETPGAEHLEIAATFASSPIAITNWSLQSALSGTRIYIPSGVSPFVVGTLNQLSPITLAAGDTALLTSGFSPVGASFKENACTGYLTQFQTFSPPLSRQCPLPADEMPRNASTIAQYGNVCVDFVHTLAPCTFHTGFLPQGAGASCAAFVGDALSHNGCVARHRNSPYFESDSWRVFLNAPSELWRNTHDVIRLLDADGRVVDVLSY